MLCFDSISLATSALAAVPSLLAWMSLLLWRLVADLVVSAEPGLLSGSAAACLLGGFGT